VGDVRLICDASSDILSRKIEVDKYALIYAGAQKNLGTPGVTIVIINKDFIRNELKNVPILLNYKTYLDSNSLYNTPPVSNIMVLREMLIWMKEIGGLSEIEKLNNKKAEALYSLLDSSSLYIPYADPLARSNMNVTFTLKDQTLESTLLKHLQNENYIGIKGHRSIGGFRVSLYNALSLEDVNFLCDVLRGFEEKMG
jgi:phosphoserine aminotransferase